MRALALDIGDVRIGVAVSDPNGRVATPICVLKASDVYADAPAWRRVLADWEPDVLICGLPLTLEGEPGPQAEAIAAHAREIAARCALPLEFFDERFSSAEARRILHEQGLSEKDMRGRIDMVAASLFLQSWLDAGQIDRA